MIIDTDKGKIKLNNFIGAMEGLPQLTFDCEIISEELLKKLEEKILISKRERFSLMEKNFKEKGYSSLEQFEHENFMEEYCFIILYISKESNIVTARLEKGGMDDGEMLEYFVNVDLELIDTKQQLKPLILSSLESCYF